MAEVKINELPSISSANNTDNLVIDDGNTTYKITKEDFIGTNKPFSFVGMVVQGTTLNTLTNVQDIYGTNTNWTLISSVALGSEHVFGNGKGLGFSNGGSSLFNLKANGAEVRWSNTYNTTIGSSASGNATVGTFVPGIPSKEILDNRSASYDGTGLIADTITVYMWERIA